MNVSLLDLGITIKAYRKVNLLHNYNLTYDQIIQSAKSGSIFKKSHLVSYTETTPEKEKIKLIEISKPTLLTPVRNAGVKVSIPKYEDLDGPDILGTDEQFALEQADAEFQDTAPATLAVDDKFAKDE